MIDLRQLREAATNNLFLKVSSLLFALGLWAFVNLGAREAEKSLFVQLELRNLPEEVMVTSPIVEGVDVRLRGPRTLLGPIDENRLGLWLDLSKIRPGRAALAVEPDQLSLPQGVRVTRLSPAEVAVQVERVSQRSIAVDVSSETAVPAGYRLVGLEVRPRRVRVIGPASEVRALQQLVTRPLTLRSAVTAFEESVGFEGLSQFVRTVPVRVVVRGRLEEVMVRRTIPKLPMRVRNASGPARLDPPFVEVNLYGPERILDTSPNAEMGVFVDANGLGAGSHVVPVVAEYPASVKVEGIKPRTVTVTVGPAEE